MRFGPKAPAFGLSCCEGSYHNSAHGDEIPAGGEMFFGRMAVFSGGGDVFAGIMKGLSSLSRFRGRGLFSAVPFPDLLPDT